MPSSAGKSGTEPSSVRSAPCSSRRQNRTPHFARGPRPRFESSIHQKLGSVQHRRDVVRGRGLMSHALTTNMLDGMFSGVLPPGLFEKGAIFAIMPFMSNSVRFVLVFVFLMTMGAARLPKRRRCLFSWTWRWNRLPTPDRMELDFGPRHEPRGLGGLLVFDGQHVWQSRVAFVPTARALLGAKEEIPHRNGRWSRRQLRRTCRGDPDATREWQRVAMDLKNSLTTSMARCSLCWSPCHARAPQMPPPHLARAVLNRTNCFNSFCNALRRGQGGGRRRRSAREQGPTTCWIPAPAEVARGLSRRARAGACRRQARRTVFRRPRRAKARCRGRDARRGVRHERVNPELRRTMPKSSRCSPNEHECRAAGHRPDNAVLRVRWARFVVEDVVQVAQDGNVFGGTW